MLEKFYPDVFLDSINEIDFNLMKQNNIKGLILDIDNTLVASNIKDADEKTIQWIKKVKDSGYKICIVSNATKRRVDRFNERLGVSAIYRAWKPNRKAFLKAAANMGIPVNQVAVIGDQIFTDIYGGNKVGMHTILVKPVGNREFIFVKLKRFPEKLIMNRYVRKK